MTQVPHLAPVAPWLQKGKLGIVRVADKNVEFCADNNTCVPWSVNNFSPEHISDLTVGDFDHGNLLDIALLGQVDGNDAERVRRIWIIGSRGKWLTATVLAFNGMNFLVGNIEGKGAVNLVVQKMTAISDFAAKTAVFTSDNSGQLSLIEYIRNFDNHYEAADLIDINQDGFLDYLQTGVDSNAVGIQWGRKGMIGDAVTNSGARFATCMSSWTAQVIGTWYP